MNASWVAIDLMEFAVRTEDAVQSPEAALEWLRSFRDTLLMEGRNSRPMPWAVELLGMADVKIAKKSIARMQGQIVKLFGKDCDVDLECSKKYGEKYEKLKNILAAATTREGVDESANGCDPLTADASTREGEDERQHPSDGELLESATSANHYDQETYQVSTNSPEGAGVNLDSTHTISPDASSGNAEGVNSHGSPITRNGSRAACTSSTSGRTISATEALEQPGAGEVTPDSVSAPSSALPVISFGEFGNIKMTNMQYAKLCERFVCADTVIEEADQYFEAQPAKKKKYKNHYAMLLNWCKRRETEAKPQQRYKNINDINRENCEQIERDLRAMFHPEEVI